MQPRGWVAILACVSMLGGLFPAFGQETEPEEPAVEEEAEGQKELKFGGTPYVYTGPDTGFGVGFALLYRDMFNKEGRDTTLSMTLTQSMKQEFSIEWQEPFFLSENGRLKIGFSYGTEPALRFYGIGNEIPLHGTLSNYSWTSASISTTYVYRWPRTKIGLLGFRAGFTAKYADPDDGELDDEDAGSYNRGVKDAYPDLYYYSGDFDPNWIIGPGLSVYHDSRVDRFPLGGGREEVVWPLKGGYEEIGYSRNDSMFGSDLSFQSATVDVRRYFPLFSEDTIVAVRGKVTVKQGNVPFYDMCSHELRGYYARRFLDKNLTLYNVELRQGFFPDAELPVLGGVIKLKYPSLLLFWESSRVYEDIEDIPEYWLEDYHYTWGAGFRFVITPSVVIRFEWGYSDEQNTFAVNAGLPF